MNVIIVKRKSDPHGAPFAVYRQGNGHPVLVLGGGSEEFIEEKDLLFPQKNSANLHLYVQSTLQGLLANPNIVKSLNDLTESQDLFNIIETAEIVAAWEYYSDLDIEYKSEE